MYEEIETKSVWPASTSGSLAPGSCQAVVTIILHVICSLEWNEKKKLRAIGHGSLSSIFFFSFLLDFF